MDPKLCDHREEIGKFLDDHRFANETRDRYGRALRRVFEEYSSLELLTSTQFRIWLYANEWQDSNRWIYFSAIKGFIRWKYGDRHPALSLKIKRAVIRKQRSMRLDQVNKLLASFNLATDKGIRDIAIACLLLDSGIRNSELCGLRMNEVDLIDRTIETQIKGGKMGKAVFSPVTGSFLEKWLEVRPTYAKQDVRTFFVSVGGLSRGKPLSRYGLQQVVKVWAKRAGLAALSPHDFRRTFANLSTKNGAPSRVLQIAGRWSNINMVEVYTRDLEAEDFAPYWPTNKTVADDRLTEMYNRALPIPDMAPLKVAMLEIVTQEETREDEEWNKENFKPENHILDISNDKLDDQTPEHYLMHGYCSCGVTFQGQGNNEDEAFTGLYRDLFVPHRLAVHMPLPWMDQEDIPLQLAPAEQAMLQRGYKCVSAQPESSDDCLGYFE